MTLKSIYSQATRPRHVFVSLLQQNCFGPRCRTGILVGGVVEDAGPDDNCYELFCASPEGIASKACGTDQIRLFNVNESESLGPYMARSVNKKSCCTLCSLAYNCLQIFGSQILQRRTVLSPD